MKNETIDLIDIHFFILTFDLIFLFFAFNFYLFKIVSFFLNHIFLYFIYYLNNNKI
jgi:hypothetical protein